MPDLLTVVSASDPEMALYPREFSYSLLGFGLVTSIIRKGPGQSHPHLWTLKWPVNQLEPLLAMVQEPLEVLPSRWQHGFSQLQSPSQGDRLATIHGQDTIAKTPEPRGRG